MIPYSDNKYSMKKALIYLALAAIACLTFFVGCTQNITSNKGLAAYYTEITVIKDLDSNKAAVTVYLTRNDTVLETADITFGDYALNYSAADTVYKRIFKTADSIPSQTYNCVIIDGTALNDTVSLTVPSDLEITSVALPDDRVDPAGDAVQFQWSQSLMSNGYVFAANHVDSLYETDGYADFSPENTPQATVPPDAFRPGGVPNPVLGWYYIYAYAYTGVPTDATYLPTYFPQAFTNNLDKTDIAGSYGVVVISPRDSIDVTESL